MHIKGFVLLSIITILVIVLIRTLIISQETSNDVRQTLFPGLIDNVNDVASLTIRDTTTITTIEQDQQAPEQWNVIQHHNYPANFNKVRTTVLGIANLMILESRTSNPERFHLIDLDDLDNSSSKAIEVILYDVKGVPLASLLRGKTSSLNRSDTFFVRKNDDTQSWLVQGTLTIQAKPSQWLDRDLPTIEQNQVKRIIIRHPDGETLMFERDTQEQPLIATGLPPNGAPKAFDINNLTSILQYLSFDDVSTSDQLDFSDANDVVITEVQTFDNMTIVVRLITHEEKDWIRFAATMVDSATQESDTSTETTELAETAEPAETTELAETTEPDETAEPDETTELAETTEPDETTETDETTQITTPQPDDTLDPAQVINDRYSHWAYQISSYTANRIKVRGIDLVDFGESAPGEE